MSVKADLDYELINVKKQHAKNVLCVYILPVFRQLKK